MTSPQLIAFWYGQSTFVDGLSQETCRDFGHVQYGLAAMINAAGRGGEPGDALDRNGHESGAAPRQDARQLAG